MSSESLSAWPMTKLEDFAADEPRSITDGPFGSNLKTAHYTEHGPRVIRLQNIGNSRFIDEPAHISEEHYSKLRAHSAEAGDVVVASLGNELPRACTVPSWLGPAIVKADCIRLRPAEDVDGRYVMYMLNAPQSRDAVKEMIHGVGRPRLGLRVIRNIEIPRAPLEEQERIVEAIEEQLSRLDAGVESLQRAGRNLARMRRSVVMSVFQRDWPEVELGDVADISGGITKNKRLEADPSSVEVPYLRVANVQRGFLDLTDVKTIRAPRAKVEKTLLQDGDVLFTEGGDRDKLGRGWVWRRELERCAHQNHVFRARVDPAHFVPEFLSTYANQFGRGWFEEMGKQTTNLASISLSTLRRFPIPAPSLAAQEEALSEIERQGSILDSVEVTIRSNLDRAGGLRRSVLMGAFSGRLTHASQAGVA